jgi:predicted Zn-ribbon and HTH transcriptional regulator
VDSQTAVLQDLEEMGQVFLMFFQCAACFQMVIQISEHKWEAAEQAVHQTLESLSRIHQPEGHEYVLKQSEWCHNCCFLMSSGDIGTWWYPLTKSTTEKNLQPCNFAERS